MSKLMHLLIMYHEIQRLKRDGFSVAWISREVVLNRRTVKKYLAMSEEEFLEYINFRLIRLRYFWQTEILMSKNSFSTYYLMIKSTDPNYYMFLLVNSKPD